MLLNLLVGLPVMLLCLVMEAIFVTLCLRYYANHYKRFKDSGRSHKTLALDILLLGMVMLLMLLMLLGNFAQMIIWAALFMLIGEFEEGATAMYYSAVNFATLGYGDIVMSERWRMLGPLEAANGILMFGVSTAVMTAAVMDVIKHNIARLQQSQQP
ncbi:Ion channel [compost metagenome]